tara:strand:+ start:4279 stop:4932 length:654 start_codon:yes stop_codon:yes gene_type:complete
MPKIKPRRKTPAEPIKPTRTRLEPEVRKELILDAAADLVAEEGVSAVSMERLGREAGVSKSLIYAYYPNLQDVLSTLLKREYRRLRNQQIEAAEQAGTFAEMIRLITGAYMNYMDQRGLILERLSAEPSFADHGDPTEYNRSSAVNYLADILHNNYDLELGLAKAVLDISFGLPAAGGHYLIREGTDRELVEDITVTMITGSIQAVLDKYGTSRKKL